MGRTVAQLRSDYSALCERLGARGVLHTTPQHDGSPHVECVGESYHYVVTERGSEFDRRRTNDPEELLYWLMSGVVFSLASEYELRHRIEGQDPRRLLFQKEIDLMERLSDDWARLKRDEIQRTLSTHPYDDP